MTTYGLLIVDTNWTNDEKVEIGKTTHLRHKNDLVEGAKAMVYVRHPVDAIVAEVELTGGVIQEENAPEETTLNPAAAERSGNVLSPSQLMEKTYSVPIRALRLKGQCEPLPINRVQKVLGSDFTVFDETWMPLTQAQYETLAALWEKA